MISINASSSNSFVLASLRQTNADLATTQNRIASGLKVASAKDNASVWSVAQTIRSDIAAQDTITASIALTKGQADAGYEALTAITDILVKMKAKSQEIVTGSANNVNIQKDIALYQSQIMAIAKSSSIQGVNFLTTNGATVTATIGQDQGIAVTSPFTTTLIVNTANTPTSGLLTNGAANSFGNILNTTFVQASTAGSANDNQDTFSDAIDAALGTLATYTASVGTYSQRLASQEDFLAKINDIRKTALSSLVDANMEEESAKVSALQVKQQLAFQALAISNNSAQNILTLFR